MALVTTPDVAKDLFRGLWDQAANKELLQAYRNLDNCSSGSRSEDESLLSHGRSGPESGSSSPQSPVSNESGANMNTHPYYGAPMSTNRYTQLALLLVSQSQGQSLSREEEEKRRVRRERNKVAATKCREKRKAHSVYVRHEYTQVTDTTKKLEDQISALKRERDELMRVLDNHECHNPGLARSTPPAPVTLHHHIPHHQQHHQHLLQQSQLLPNSPALSELFIKTEPSQYH